MVRVDFNRSLCELEADLHRLGRLVEQAVIKAMDALKSQDLQASSEVVMANDLIDEMRFQLEEQCIDLMATQQPLAVDLRTLVAVLHLAVELERIGDYAEGIGKIGLTLGENAPLTIPENIFLMADKARALLFSRSFTSSQRAARRRDRSTSSSKFPRKPLIFGPNATLSKIDLGNGLGRWKTMPIW